jgi:hypothetical protein
MKLKYLLAASVVSLAATTTFVATPAFAQETTSSVRGEVVDQNGNPIPGATVTVTHTPSGTTSTQTTDAAGGFNAAGLRLGGPFTVSVTADNYETAEQEIGFLTAGQAQRISVSLADIGKTIVVSGARQRSSISLGTGAATVLTARDIAGVSNVNRDIRNLALRDPLVTLDATNGNAISILGQNNRFNRFSVDGVAFGDPFGLESGGLVSSRGPVPLDAIGEFSVEVAPVDIQQGFFQGGAINTQLRSGGNNFTFLGGFYYQDDNLRGDRARERIRTGAFDSKIYTAQVTGPIIKDKLFFAVTYERTRETVPADVDPAVLGITDADITQISDIAQNVYNFDTLGVANNVVEKDDKLVTKLDWNIADGHRLTATYIWNDSALLAGQTGVGEINNVGNGNPTYSLLSNNYTQGAVNHFGIIQSNNQWSDSFSTQLRVSYADYTRLQVPVGGNRDFGQFQVCLDPVNPATGVGAAERVCSPGQERLQFGPDISRQANELETQSLAIEFQAALKLNNHNVKFIAERRTQDIRNLFAQRVSGAWLFDSVADLQARRANEVDIAVPLLGGIETVTADFQNNSWTFGIMDTIDVTDTLTVVAGMRYDLFDTPDRPFNNEAFLSRFGFTNISTLNGRDLFQPRFGFNWKPTDRLQVRGSAGLFGAGSPNVWVSNSYSNPGPTLGRVQVRRVRGVNGAPDTFTIAGLTGLSAAQQNAIGAATLNNVTGGTGIPQSLIDAIRTTGTAASPTNAIDPNFDVPSQWRFSGSVDYEADLGFLGDGWNFGVDVIYSKVKDGLEWTDLRSVPTGTTTPDGRPRYNIIAGQTGVNTDILLTNTDEGDSWNIVGRFSKSWDAGFFLNGAYTYQKADDQNPGTSSVAFSNYTNTAVGEDPNFAAVGISNYQRDHQFRLGAGYDAELFGDNTTRIELFYNVRSGQRYSYTFNDPTNGRSAVFGVTGRGGRNLFYVPDVSSATADPNVVYAPNFDFVGFQNFIQNSELADYQGEVAPKNIAKTPWVHKLDLSVRQEVPLPFGGKMELLADVENVLNLIDSDWGTVRQVGFPYTATLVNVACLQAPGGAPATTPSQPCAQYSYSSFRAPNEATQINGSLWGVRFGVRVRF